MSFTISTEPTHAEKLYAESLYLRQHLNNVERFFQEFATCDAEWDHSLTWQSIVKELNDTNNTDLSYLVSKIGDVDFELLTNLSNRYRSFAALLDYVTINRDL